MKLLSCFVVLIFALQNLCFVNTTITTQQWIYDYNGIVDAKTTVCDQCVARWAISGKLTIQSFEKYIVLQLKDIQTTVFNAKYEDLNLSQMKDISDEAKVLSKPFVAHIIDENISSLDVTPNEPIWAINIKRSIVSQFNVLAKTWTNRAQTMTTSEESLYGECDVFYEVQPNEEDLKIIKKINPTECKNSPFIFKGNVKRAKATINYEPFQVETIKSYNLKQKNGLYIFGDTFSISNISYKLMPKMNHSQHIDQYQEFKLSQHDFKIENALNIEENTDKMNLTYEFDMESVYPRSKKNYTGNELVKEFLDNYEEFHNKSYELPLNNINITDPDNVYSMFLALFEMKDEDLKQLQEEITLRDDESYVTFLTLLPYIGTNTTNKYISSLIHKFLLRRRNKYHAIRLLTLLPKYIGDPTEDVVESFEYLLELDTIEFPIKSAGILSFASIVNYGYEKGSINKNTVETYKNIFYNNFMNGCCYKKRMTYLLGLVNMQNSLSTEFIIPILKNTSESSNMRALGISSFKNRLVTDPEIVFENFWPISLNKSESFDVRVASLDLLLSTNLSEEHFKKIVDSFKSPPEDIFEMHILHYFQTTILSLQNITQFSHPLGSKATTLLESEDFSVLNVYSDASTTSNYLVEYTDSEPNLGRSFQARLIANPVTNTINTIHFNYNYFFMSFDMGTYSIYLKLDNLFEHKYRNNILKQLENNTLSIPELIDLLNEFHLELKNDVIDFHVEIVFFIDNQAFFSMYINRKNIDEFTNFGYDVINNFEVTTKKSKYISFPLMDYSNFPSDLGTSIKITNDMQDITAGGFPGALVVYRNIWNFETWLEAYNPLAETSVGNFLYYGINTSINITFIGDILDKIISFSHWNDSFIYTKDNLIGLWVEDESVLKSYCPKCEKYYEYDDYIYSTSVMKYPSFNIKFQSDTLRFYDYEESYDYLTNMLNSFQCNINTFPLAKPLLTFWYLMDYLFYFNSDLQSATVRSISDFQNVTVGLIQFKLNGDNSLDPIYGSNNINITVDYAASRQTSKFVENNWIATFAKETIEKYINETGKFKIAEIYTYDYEFTDYNSTNITYNLVRELLFPNLRIDKFSLLPQEPTTGTIKIRHCKSEECETNIKYSEIIWTSDNLIGNVKSNDAYQTCEKDSADLKFTPPTKECMEFSQKVLNEYDNYKFMDTNGDPLILFSKEPADILKVSFFETEWTDFSFDQSATLLNHTFYNPYSLVNPNVKAYNDYEVIFGKRKYCVVTPKTVKTFNQNTLTFNENNPVAMIECSHKPQRGITIQKFSDKHIGFKLWSKENILVVTMKNNEEMEVQLNGSLIRETYFDAANNFKVQFLDKNVIFVVEKEIRIYYNTEYIFMDVKSLYSSYLCGFCSQSN